MCALGVVLECERFNVEPDVVDRLNFFDPWVEVGGSEEAGGEAIDERVADDECDLGLVTRRVAGCPSVHSALDSVDAVITVRVIYCAQCTRAAYDRRGEDDIWKYKFKISNLLVRVINEQWA